MPKLNEFNLNLCSGWYGANLRKNSFIEEKESIQQQLKLFSHEFFQLHNHIKKIKFLFYTFTL